MIAREVPVFLLRPRVIAGAGLISLAVCLLLPLISLLLWVGGALAFILLWVIVGLLFAVFYVLLIGGGIAAIGGIFALFGGSNDEERGTGCMIVVVGGIAAAIGSFTTGWWGDAYSVVGEGAMIAYDFCSRNAEALLTDVWLDYGIVWLAWLILLGELLAALFIILLIGLLRLKDWSRGPLGRIYYACPYGHRAGVSFECPSCREFEPVLRPSIYGVLTASCQCGERLPTCDVVGRFGLGKCCRDCPNVIDHPDSGRLPEYHILAWDPVPTRTKQSWLDSAVRELSANGAEVTPDSPPDSSLPALMLSGRECGRGLTYIYSHTGGGATALPAVVEPHHRWLSGLILVLAIPPGDASASGLDGIVSSLLNFWDRVQLGRSWGRHSAVLGVVVHWEATASFGSRSTKSPELDSNKVRTALERAGFENLVHALEARFRRIAFFALNSPSGSGVSAVPCSMPSAALQWVCQEAS